ncbi:MAG: gamma-glutamyltransferase family protein, partial [Planctomycetes bacterium]|nr:gamma-glutamyltransferase family protein [Planctomycetota bacterium]
MFRILYAGILVVLMEFSPLAAQPYDRPSSTRSARSMVLAKRGAVCASQPLATAAGLAVLRKGGNAFDAAVATAAVLNVVEPMSTGIGGDMFVLAWSAKEKKLVGLNGSGRSAAKASVESYRALGLNRIPTFGAHAVTVPGAFHGWCTLIDKYGSLPLKDILADAIGYAEDGFPVSEVIAGNWRSGMRHQGGPEFAKNYLVREDDQWRSPRLGEIFRQPDLGRTFRELATGGIEHFYRGALGRRIASYLESRGSLIRFDDLQKHNSTWVEPVSTEYKGHQLYELPPNGQGIVALELLNILEAYDLRSLGPHSADYIPLLTEAKKLAFADRDTCVTALDTRKLPVETLISKEYAAKMRARIDPKRAKRFPRSTLDIGNDTVYLCTADSEGNMVSFINSIYYGFGSGLVVPGTGICLQNRGALFRLSNDHLNRIEPSKRPLLTILPAFVMREGKPWFCYGVMGGDMQPQGHAQVLLNMVEFGMNPQEA